MKRQSEALQKSVVNSKSMRDNLVFICISERDDEGCKQVIQNFMKTKLSKLRRIAKKYKFRMKPWTIVAKFWFFRTENWYVC